jgi:hypothetical protein
MTIKQKEILKGIQTEIVAGSVLVPKNEADVAWNRANLRARSIIQNYIDGYGLYQKSIMEKVVPSKTKSKGKKNA